MVTKRRTDRSKDIMFLPYKLPRYLPAYRSYWRRLVLPHNHWQLVHTIISPLSTPYFKPSLTLKPWDLIRPG